MPYKNPTDKHSYFKRRNKERVNERLRLIRLLGSKCSRCGITDPMLLELDHINPISVNGNRSHKWKDVNNLQVLCKNCNKFKGHKYIKYRFAGKP